MSPYPVTIRRCQHIKVNGIQCGSPALRDERRCFFHEQCLVRSRRDLLFNEPGISQLASLEDANSIQLALAEVLRLVATGGIGSPYRLTSTPHPAHRRPQRQVHFLRAEANPGRSRSQLRREPSPGSHGLVHRRRQGV